MRPAAGASRKQRTGRAFGTETVWPALFCRAVFFRGTASIHEETASYVSALYLREFVLTYKQVGCIVELQNA